MNTSRRDFLRLATVVAGGIVAEGGTLLKASPAQALPSANFPPAGGNIFYGASQGSPATLADYCGKSLGIDREYFQAANWQKMIDYAAAAVGRGSVPLVSTKAPTDWASMADGAADNWAMNIIAGLKDVRGPVLWTIHHEPENDVNGTNMTAASFKAMYGRIAALHPSPSTSGVWFGPTLMGGKYNQLSTPNLARRQFLDDWVHPAAHAGFFDAYNHWSPGGSARWRSVPQTFDHMVNGYTDRRSGAEYPGYNQVLPGKPIVIAEYGVRYDPTGTYDAVQWMNDAYAYGTANGVAGMSFFSSDRNVNDGGTAWTLDGPRLDAFRQLLRQSTSMLLD